MAISLLVADDSKLSRRSVIKALPPELEFDISEAANGKEAIACLAEKSYQLLLLDLTMPEIDGVGVLEHLQTALRATRARRARCALLADGRADLRRRFPGTHH